MSAHEALRQMVQSYRSSGGGALPASQAARLIELAAQAMDEVSRLRVQVEVMSMEVDAHESISAELQGTLARSARQTVETNPYPQIQGEDTDASLHDDWQRGWHAQERLQELEFRVRALQSENAELRRQLGSTPDETL